MWDACNECGGGGLYETFVMPAVAAADTSRPVRAPRHSSASSSPAYCLTSVSCLLSFLLLLLTLHPSPPSRSGHRVLPLAGSPESTGSGPHTANCLSQSMRSGFVQEPRCLQNVGHDRPAPVRTARHSSPALAALASAPAHSGMGRFRSRRRPTARK